MFLLRNPVAPTPAPACSTSASVAGDSISKAHSAPKRVSTTDTSTIVRSCMTRLLSTPIAGRQRPAIGVDNIRVIQDLTIVLVSVVETLFGAECAFDIESPATLAEVLQAGAGVGATGFRRRNIGLGRRQRFGRPQSAAAETEVDLLGLGEGRQCG